MQKAFILLALLLSNLTIGYAEFTKLDWSTCHHGGSALSFDSLDIRPMVKLASIWIENSFYLS